jgi:hypothetical protein
MDAKTLQRYMPVLVSICLIVGLAVLRNRSRTLAALLATMPINLPLGFWIVYSGGADQSDMSNFARSALVALVQTFIWILAVLFLLRAGWTLWPAMLGGYVAWLVLVGIMFAVGWLHL